MTTYTISCATLSRLSKIPSYFGPSVPEHTKPLINTVRLENKGGKSYAVATNQKIAAVEYLGPTPHPDSFCHLKLPIPRIDELARNNETATIMTIPQIAVSTLTTTGGFALNDVSYWFDETPLDSWRTWFNPNIYKNSQGAMYWDLFHLELLFQSSPSGKVIFPEFIQADKPVLLTDRENDKWLGAFIPNVYPTEKAVKPSKLPEWME